MINEFVIRDLICPHGRAHLEVFDPEVRGLYVDVLKSGRKSFRLRYRFEKNLRVATIGDAEVMSLEEARQRAREILGLARGGKDPRAGKDLGEGQVVTKGPRLRDFLLESYLPYVKGYKRSWATDESMIRNHLLPALGSQYMCAIRPPDISVMLGQMKARGYASGTCNRALVLLRYGFALAIRWRLPGVVHNPALEIKGIWSDNRIERYLSADQMRALMHSVSQSENEMLQFIVLFLIYTGARKREVLDARWRDIDWAQLSWRIPKTKSGKVRHVPLSGGALSVLEGLRSMGSSPPKEDGAIFANPKTGEPFVSFFYSWDNARKRAGLKEFRIHDLRHSFASYLVNAGRSLYEVQELLGHADIKTTSRYAHLSRERLVAAVGVVPRVEIVPRLALTNLGTGKDQILVT